jgi:hypothetical protein
MTRKISEIRNDVPVEVSKRFPGAKHGGRPFEELRYKMEKLNIGESFTVSFENESEGKKVREKISSTRTNVMKSKTCRFKIKKQDGNSFIVWRIE